MEKRSRKEEREMAIVIDDLTKRFEDIVAVDELAPLAKAKTSASSSIAPFHIKRRTPACRIGGRAVSKPTASCAFGPDIRMTDKPALPLAEASAKIVSDTAILPN